MAIVSDLFDLGLEFSKVSGDVSPQVLEIPLVVLPKIQRTHSILLVLKNVAEISFRPVRARRLAARLWLRILQAEISYQVVPCSSKVKIEHGLICLTLLDWDWWRLYQ